MSDAQEDHSEASNTSFEAEPAKENGHARRNLDSPIDGDDSSSSIFLTEFSNENSENDYASGSDYESNSSLYNSEKEDKAKSSKSDAKSAKPKRAYRKPRKRHRTDVNQLKRLEEVYQYDSNPNQELRVELAKESGMSTRQIQVWFQNRRAKTRRDAARMQLKASSKEAPEGSSAEPAAATEEPASTTTSAPPTQSKPPKEPKKRGPKGKRNAQAHHHHHHHHHHHKHKHGHTHDNDGNNDDDDNGKVEENEETKKPRRRGRKRARVDKDGSSQSELSSESDYSEGDSSSANSSESGSPTESSSSSSSSSSSEDNSVDLQSEFPNPSYLYQKVLDYLKRDKKIDPQESIEQDEKRLFG